MKNSLLLFSLLLLFSKMQASSTLYQATKYLDDPDGGIARIGVVSKQHRHSMLNELGFEYITALRNGTPLPNLDDKNMQQSELEWLKSMMRPAMGSPLKTAVLPPWLARDFRNYTYEYAHEKFGDKHGSGVADRIGSLRGYMYIRYGQDPSFLRKELDEDTRLQFYLNKAYKFLDPTNIDADAVEQQVLALDSLVTYISVHAPDMRNFRDTLDRIFTHKPQLTLVVNFDDVQQTDRLMVPNSIKKLSIVGRNLTEVGNFFLSRCLGLTSLQLPAGLTQVGYSFLAGCSGLTELRLPAGLTTVGNFFLAGCSGLTNLQLPAGLTQVGYSFLVDCTGLTELRLPAGLTTVGDNFLAGCSGLTNLQLPAGLRGVGGYFLSDCTGLTSLELPAGLRTVGYGFLVDCSGLTSLQLQAVLTTVGDRFLYGCKGLTSLELPPNLTTVGNDFLYNCTGLRSLQLPAGLRTVGYGFLKGCSELRSLDLSSLAGLTTVGNDFLAYCTGLIELRLPAGLTTVGNEFLAGCRGLTSLELPAGLTTVGNNFLTYCTGLTELRLLPGLTTVGNNFLYNCSGLRSLSIGRELFEKLGGYDYFINQNIFPLLTRENIRVT